MKSHNSMLPETRITEVWGLGLTGERPPTYVRISKVILLRRTQADVGVLQHLPT